MIMKTRYFKLVTVCLLAVSLFASCLGDLDTLPLDDNELTGEMVYSTPEGYIGMIAKCYAALIQTGQKGGDGGDGDVSGIDEGYSGYTRALFYLQEACTDEIVFQSGGSKGVRAMLYLNWDASTEIVGYPYYRLFMTINYCNEFLRECTESKLQERGVYEALKDEYQYYCAEARFIRAYSYSMLCDLYGSTPFVDETMEVGDMPEQATREEIYNFVVSELEELTTLLKEPKKNEYARVDRVAAWFLLSRVYLNAETWVGKNEYTNAYKYAKKVITEGNYPLASDYRHIFLADNETCSEIIWPLVQDADYAQGSSGTNFLIKALMNGDMGLFGAIFQEKYGPLIDKLFSQITAADDTQLNARKQSELQENIVRYTDFRTYLRFDLETTDQNGTKQLLSQTLNTKSGGETQTPFYIAVLASFAQLYRTSDATSFGNTVRLVVFDEAFNKMDSDRITESVRLLRKMGLQAIVCTPPDKVADIMPIADRTLLVDKTGYRMHIIPFGKENAG